MLENYIFTSESVSEGHPDKIADQISDAILDEILKQDKNARVACECFVKTGMVLIGGEITTTAWADFDKIVRDTIKEIGYDSSEMGFDYGSCAVLSAIGKQSTDIAVGVDKSESRLGAGDQGMMFGYASTETDVYMPAPITYAHRLVKKQAELRKSGKLPWLRPDAKSQVSLRYENGKPVHVDAVVISTQHSPDISHKELSQAVIDNIIKPVLPKKWIDDNTKFIINPTGQFIVGGPLGDCGLTGRKIIVDTYGGFARHGGGCFSGKDPTKVDRSAAYFARFIAKNLVAAGIADKLELQLSYAIGLSDPISLAVNTYNTSSYDDEVIIELIKSRFDMTPSGIIDTLKLKDEIYKPSAAYGHFGREDVDFSWESLSMVSQLQSDLNKVKEI